MELTRQRPELISLEEKCCNYFVIAGTVAADGHSRTESKSMMVVRYHAPLAAMEKGLYRQAAVTWRRMVSCESFEETAVEG